MRATERRARVERALGLTLVVLAVPAALIFDSAFFRHGGWLGGDHLYHGGVALNLQGGGLVGRDYYAGHLSYFSGLYHLVVSDGVRLLGTSYDSFVSVASWWFGPVWIGALLLLARRLWPGDWLRAGYLVVLATFAAPLSTAPRGLWVSSLLPSGHVEWPVYPRDFALLGGILVAWSVTSEHWWVRTVGTGLFLAATMTTHPQIGALTAIVAIATVVIRDGRRPVRVLQDLAVITGAALIAGIWWWWPHLLASLHDQPIAYGQFPSRVGPGALPANLASRLGLALPLGLGGLALLATGRAWRDKRLVVIVWLGVLAVASLALAVSPNDFLDSNRAWVFAGPAVAVVAAEGAAWLTRRIPLVLTPAVAVVIIATSIPALVQTADVVEHVWRSPRIANNGVAFTRSTWDPIWQQLNHEVRARDGARVTTYESYGAITWERSGATVFDLWLPAILDPGYSAKKSTGLSIRERTKLEMDAFAHGLPGVCSLARRTHADDVLLERVNGLVGTRDTWPAARFRPDRTTRGRKDLFRKVGPGEYYRDLSAHDDLMLTNGARLRVSWPGSAVNTVVIYAISARGVSHLQVQSGALRTTVHVPQRTTARPVMVRTTPHEPIVIRAHGHVGLLGLRGFERVPRLAGPDGPFLAPVGRVCAGVPEPAHR